MQKLKAKLTPLIGASSLAAIYGGAGDDILIGGTTFAALFVRERSEAANDERIRKAA